MRKLSSLKHVHLKDIKIKDAFWGRNIALVREEVIPYQWNALNDRVPGVEPSYAIENFRIAAGETKGEFLSCVFQDSDLVKWIEAVGYSLETHPDPELEKQADELIDLIGKAQQPDGYLNTYYTIAEPGKRWTDLRMNHELYCAGHMMEAAVAYYEATGKRKLLDIVCRFADHIDSVFGKEPGKKRGYPGHEEIELALVKLYKVTGEEKYLNLSKYFIDERGRKPHYFDIEAVKRGQKDHSDYFGDYSYVYAQCHKPVREQTDAVGHAVRAMYLYCGMADVAAETGDETLLVALRRLWESVTKRRMYITGGVGSSAYAESFTTDYDLPNDTSYTETCASIGLVFFAHRMLQIEADSRYADVMERALYNGILSGMSLDGRKFFYVNPLEVWPQSCENRKDKSHIKTVRQGWFGCACCPPNVARLVASFGRYTYSESDDGIYVHLYAGSEAILKAAGKKAVLIQKTGYPWTETVEIIVKPEEAHLFTLALRIPGWCRKASLKVNNEEYPLDSIVEKGYAKVRRVWREGDKVELTLPMPVERIMANPEVRVNTGKVALQRGPVVYCLEEADNGKNLWDIVLPKDSRLTAEYDSEFLNGAVVIKGEALRSENPSWGEDLYRPAEYLRKKVSIKAVPYSMWCNREPGEMIVWIREGVDS